MIDFRFQIDFRFSDLTFTADSSLIYSYVVGNLKYNLKSAIRIYLIIAAPNLFMHKPAFDIISTELTVDDRLNCHLLLQISDRVFSWIMFDTIKRKLFGVRQYHFDQIHDISAAKQLEEVLNNDTYLQEETKEVVIVYNYCESNLIPGNLFDIAMNKSVTDLVFGSVKKGLIFSEKVKTGELYNVYRIPRDTHTLLQQRFVAGKYWHLYTLLLVAYGIEKEDVCRIIFYSDCMVVALHIKGILQLIQTWTYQTPEDVAYYLLLICQQFKLNQETLRILIAGLIDEQSALYSELLKYFQLVIMEPIPTDQIADDLLDTLPLHYFSPLVKMVTCVL